MEVSTPSIRRERHEERRPRSLHRINLVANGVGAMRSIAAIILGVSQPEIQRQVRQQRADIDALYELVERVDHKVDAVDQKIDAANQKVLALDVKLDRRIDEISSQLSEVLRQLGGR